ncbi:MAG: efflux RND transporter permease subunit [Chloroherpetonaceae bacterium]|nr:efflux RND transporter permease subunit [Chloroherpetonaceae bacterium]
MSFTGLFIKRPTLVVVLFAVLGLLGAFSYTQLSYELLPKISPPVVIITTSYSGASPNEVETGITKYIEDAVSGLDKVVTITSTSSEGNSVVTVEFDQAAKIDVALQDAQRKVNEIVALLPKDSKPPILSKFALDEVPVIRAGVTGNMAPREFYQFVKDYVKPELARVAGVAQITLLGGDEREIKVNVDAAKLRSYGISILQVTQAIKNSNLDFPTGRIKDTDGQFVVRLAGKFASIEELRELIVARSKQGGDVRLNDIAEIRDGQKEYKNINRINGKTSIGMFISKGSEANTVEVSKLAKKKIAELESLHAEKGLKFDIAQDNSLFTVDAADAVKHDLMIAVLLVALVMLVFLHSIRNSFIVMVAIPASLISTFTVMYFMGFTLNLMTLLALSLAVGIWVDDSIVVLENIYRHLEMGDDKRTAALKGREEIGFTALSITLVDVVVFLPLAFSGGIIGNIMRQFAIVIVVSTLFSLLVSFTITPVLASRISKFEPIGNGTLLGTFGAFFENIYSKIADFYKELLAWSLKRGWVIGTSSILLLFASCSLMPLGYVGFEFITQSDRGEFSVGIELPPSTSLEETNLISQQVETMIRDIPEVVKVSANVGASADGFLNFSSSNIADINVSLLPKAEREAKGMRSTSDVGLYIKTQTKNIPGAKIRINTIGIFGSADETPIQLVVSGTNRDSVRVGAEVLKEVIKQTKGTTDVRLSSEDGKPETRIEIDRNKMSQFGLSIADVGGSLRVLLSGDEDAKYRDGETEYDIRVQLDEFDRSNTDFIGSLTFVNPKGQIIELKQFANIYQTTGPTKLQRRDRNTAVTVLSQVAGRASGSIWQEVQGKLKTTSIPAGVTIAPQGQLKNQGDSFGSLGLAMLAGITFVYLIMVALYNSYLYPFVVLFSIPLAGIGAMFGLGLAAKTLSIFSMLGMIMLIGLVAKNAILLVDFTNKLKEEGMNTRDALLEAGRERLRPILMTTLTMIFGMMPIALSTSAGSEWKTGLAWVLIGGLTSSMLLTLLLVPIVYQTFDRLKLRLEELPFLRKKPSAISGSEPSPVNAD